ncbi:MAG: glucose-1-phosphate adenylyltransferase subunit GlgD [Lactobacillales bacterium]|jgi:glucose-1-phosphate adenylyltransferase|nr:glucose-1-phosphate adenylyltransferase subunit GlgD [Lactobacillales bacterium]
MKTNGLCALIGNIKKFDTLRDLTESRPWAMLPYASKYRIMDFQLSNVVNANVDSVFLTFSEGETQSVYDHLGGGKEWDLDAFGRRFFVYVYEDFIKNQQKGKGLFEARINFLKKSNAPYTIFMDSNAVFNIDFKDMLRVHKENKNEVTVAFKRTGSHNVAPANSVIVKGEDSRLFISKKFIKTNYDEVENLSLDTFIVDTQWLIDRLEEYDNADALGLQIDKSSMRNIQEVLNYHINHGQAITGDYEYKGYLNNIVDNRSYFEANMDMLDPEKFRQLLFNNQKIFTKIKDEAPTYYSPNSNVQTAMIATGCIIDGTVTNSIVGRGVEVESEAIVTNAIIMPGATVKAGAIVECAIVDKAAIIEEGVIVKGTEGNPVVIKKGQVVTDKIIK